MKSKKFSIIVLVVLVVGGAILWFASQVKSQKSPSILTKTEAAVTTAVPVDPRADLKTAIAELVQSIRAGQGGFDFVLPEELAKKGYDSVRIQKAREDYARFLQSSAPEMQSGKNDLEGGALIFEQMEAQTPTYNTAGNEATFVYTPMGNSGRIIPKTFIKVDGKWYLKPEALN